MVARATASQFNSGHFDIIRIPYINSVDQIEETVREAAKHSCVICHTLVSPDLRAALLEQAQRYDVAAIDIMGPMLNAVQEISGLIPRLTPGLIHKLDQEYFKRVEAVEFAVKYDDGKNPWGLLKADVVIVGVSRTSKTPLSMYLAHKKIKVANVPMVPEVPPPQELFQVPPQRIVGLVINSQKLNEIRCERLKTMGLAPNATYANMDRIIEELEYAKAIMRKLNCLVIDVSNRAIEETANKILEIVQRNNKQ
ncbi:putative pyruvate, phosphate dikinase regulatory protein [Methylomusa anaerophila]|uniref:Putative pyruvate, phosphate dikinase regulatory protein n=2 Tax=Methylomusa anaerophila TaxID=1930071 RepID=A0A348AP04_9FIRM|nr:putative pyruvate, phosphate dikinase regulatory protein [Methylomusa anaerophila]